MEVILKLLGSSTDIGNKGTLNTEEEITLEEVENGNCHGRHRETWKTHY
jgi:hypothetical protein